eukprot:350118-Hanusia_phi.AAC.5
MIARNILGMILSLRRKRRKRGNTHGRCGAEQRGESLSGCGPCAVGDRRTRESRSPVPREGSVHGFDTFLIRNLHRVSVMGQFPVTQSGYRTRLSLGAVAPVTLRVRSGHHQDHMSGSSTRHGVSGGTVP